MSHTCWQSSVKYTFPHPNSYWNIQMFHVADRAVSSIPSPIPTVTETFKCFMLLTEQCQVYIPPSQQLLKHSNVSCCWQSSVKYTFPHPNSYWNIQMFHVADRAVSSIHSPIPTVTETFKCFMLLTEQCQVYLPPSQQLLKHSNVSCCWQSSVKYTFPHPNSYWNIQMFHVADRAVSSIHSPIPTVTETLKCFMLLTEQCQVYIPPSQQLLKH